MHWQGVNSGATHYVTVCRLHELIRECVRFLSEATTSYVYLIDVEKSPEIVAPWNLRPAGQCMGYMASASSATTELRDGFVYRSATVRDSRTHYRLILSLEFYFAITVTRLTMFPSAGYDQDILKQ